MQLPEEFISYTRNIFGEERWLRFLESFEEVMPVSVRMNPWKTDSSLTLLSEIGDSMSKEVNAVPWCRNAYYLCERPNFTMDPLLHAGCYYVQEASSMFLDEIIRQLTDDSESFCPTMALDLCAAPGGKSTLLRAALPNDCVLFSNEPDRRRANILMENMQKQGHPRVYVTNNYAKDYQKARLSFDMILCDVPCSGEGMFRKDEGAIKEWSVKNVMACAELQRSIVEDIWPCLAEGGVMVYSTCTFNLHEDEENVRWICETLGAELVPIATREEWNVTGSLLEGFDGPVYRFIPGTARGEGMFMAVLRKNGGSDRVVSNMKGVDRLRVLSDGNPKGTPKGKDLIPAHAEALLINLPRDKYPQAELLLDDALRYLHHEAIQLPPDAPRGFTVVTYQGRPLGFVKNIGNRANNLYPQEWKIRFNV